LVLLSRAPCGAEREVYGASPAGLRERGRGACLNRQPHASRSCGARDRAGCSGSGTDLPLQVLPGTAPLCRGADPATLPRQSRENGPDLVVQEQAASPAPDRHRIPLPATTPHERAPREQDINKQAHHRLIVKVEEGASRSSRALPLPLRERVALAKRGRERGTPALPLVLLSLPSGEG
jgi:hypothetical protein